MKPRLTRFSLALLWFLAIGQSLFGLMPLNVSAAKRKYGDSPNSSDALFDPSRVIQIEIRLDPKDWHALRISHPIYSEDGNQVVERGYEYCRGDVVIDGQVVKSVGVRKKGTGSENTVRPAFKIKFDEYVKDQEFSGLEMLTLNNLSFDPSKAQQSVVYSFMNKAGALSPRANLARIVVNGEDLGIHGHAESIDKRFIKRHFGNAKGDLYEGQYGADFTTNAFRKLTHKWGADDDLTQVKKLVDVLESPGPVSLGRLEELVDLDAFITFWAATVLTRSADSYFGGPNNYYAYRDAKSAKFYLIPWGADAWTLAAGGRAKEIPQSVWVGGLLSRRLWELPDIREKYRTEMRRLLAEVWIEKSLLEELEQIRRLRELIEPKRMATPWFGMTGAEALADIARTIEKRRKELQIELDSPARDWPLPRAAPAADTKPTNNPPMLVEGSFSAVVREAFPTNAASYLSNGLAKLQFTVAGEIRTPFTQSGAVAVMRKELENENAIKLVVADAVGDLRWQITFRMDPYRAPLVLGPLVIGGWGGWSVLAPLSQSQGVPGARKTQSRSGGENKGTLELTHVSTNLGGTISGKFKIHTTAFDEEKKP